eukprot:jgi/Chrpa1/16194/Chrysochromulina_OHIO_Genome00004725-RA
MPPEFDPARVGTTWEEPPPQLTTLAINGASAEELKAENERLWNENRMLEQRVSREAQKWAEQRAALVKERAELQAQIAELMNGADASIQQEKKRKVTKEVDDSSKPAQQPKKGAAATAAAPAKGGTKVEKAEKAGGAKAKGDGADKGAGKGKAKTKGSSVDEAGPSDEPAGGSGGGGGGGGGGDSGGGGGGGAGGAGPSEAANVAKAIAAAKQAEVMAAAMNAVAAAEKEREAAREAAVKEAAAREAAIAAGGYSSESDLSPMDAMVSAASAILGAVFGAPAAGAASSSASDVEEVDEVADLPRKPLIGHRPRPDWVPALVDFRRAMVRSPRRKKQPMAPGEAAAKGKQQAIQEAAAVKAQALQAKKLVQQMGGVNGFAPKGAAAAPATIAKPAANGVSSARLMARSLLVLAALLALGAQGEMGKYGCHFDCYMTEEKASARGYLEYACNSTDNSTEGDNCCEPDLCLVAANELYRGKLCPAVPSNDSWSPNGFSQFQVGLDATARLDFPRNNFPCDGYLCNASLNHRTCSPLRHVCYGAGCDSLTSNSSHFIS